ncbi:MAG: alkaline phosphatase D family protein [Haliea sp.]|nr:alkaline phosphatase D family protein [Haliea sp.]
MSKRLNGRLRRISRRELLKSLAVASLVPWVVACSSSSDDEKVLEEPLIPDDGTLFFEGVVAGDPLPDGAVIWTRVAAPDDGAAVDIVWSVAEDEGFERIVTGGVTRALADNAYSAVVLVDGLDADGWYFYRFEVNRVVSRSGRLRTAPAPGSNASLRYAFASCQQRNDSFYVAHRAIAEEGVDFLMHLGDYIYVSDNGDITLDDYRNRWSIFRANPLLQDLHARVPLVAMWDDGEFYNGVDSTGDPVRLEAAKRAWFENMPVLPDADYRTHRVIRWGDTAEIFMIDVRSYRDPEVPSNTSVFGFIDGQDSRIPPGPDMFEPSRTTLGAEQKQWLLDGLYDSRSTWRLIGNPYNANPLKIEDLDTPELRAMNPNLRHNEGIYVSNESWDDYQVERKEILDFLVEHDIRNVVFSSGHTHVFFASELQPDFDDPASPVAAFDFVTGSLTADPPAEDIAPLEVLRIAQQLLLAQNAPYLKDVNLIDQGYALLDCTPEETIVTFRVIDTFDIDAQPRTYAQFRVARDSRHIERMV